MEIFLSAVLSELTSRSIDFFIRRSSKPTAADLEDRLRRVLLRAQLIMDEAMGRHITNQAMLQQLDMLRGAMHRGYYRLDTFRCQCYDEEDAKDQVVSNSLSLSKVNSLKGLYSPSTNTRSLKQLQEAIDDLSSMILDMQELVMFLTCYPRLYRQPYSMHLLLGNCMFGRQMEAEIVINFLLYSGPHGTEELEVLPIAGPGEVGKSTLVAHVLKDERVCSHFSEILFLHDYGFTDDELAAPFREVRTAVNHPNHVSNSNKDRRSLVVVELAGDVNEDAWKRFYSASKRSVTNGSKIIVTSRSEKIVRFGTARALSLDYLSHETYWYFFKTLAFGSTDPEAYPKHMHLAMEMASTMNRCFIGGNITARLLRDNFDVHFWYKVMAYLRGFIQNHVSSFGEHPFDFVGQNRPARFGRMSVPSECFVIYQKCQRSSDKDVPEIRIQDLMYGRVKPRGKFDVLTWKSQILPYHSYVSTCEIQEQKTATSKRKRSVKNGGTLC